MSVHPHPIWVSGRDAHSLVLRGAGLPLEDAWARCQLDGGDDWTMSGRGARWWMSGRGGRWMCGRGAHWSALQVWN